MNRRSVIILLICFWAVVAGCLVWQVLASRAAANPGQISIAFLGVTNDTSGAQAALFQFTNGSSRDIGAFCAGPIEVKGAGGWPSGSNHIFFVLTHLGPVCRVSASAVQTFSVPISNIAEDLTWRVPVVYAYAGSPVEGWVDHAKASIGWAVGHAASMTNTPVICGVSNVLK